MTKWDAKVEEISSIPDIKTKIAGLQRDFIVVIRETKFDAASNKLVS